MFGAVPCDRVPAPGSTLRFRVFEGIWGVWGYALKEPEQSFGVFISEDLGCLGLQPQEHRQTFRGFI